MTMERECQSLGDRESLKSFVRDGNEESFNALVQRHKLGLFNVAFRVLYDRHTAEDVVQRVFVRLVQRKAELANVRSPESWLYATTLNLAIDMQRKAQSRMRRERAARSAIGPETPSDLAIKAELKTELDLALAKLKTPLRIPLVFRYLHGMSYAEAAEVMDVSSDVVRMRARKGLRLLRKLLMARGLLIPVIAIEAGLRGQPAKAASASFLTSAASVIKAASTTGVAAEAAITMTSVVKGGLVMTAKSKIAVGVGAALILAGTVTFFATRRPHRQGAAAIDRRAAAPAERIAHPPRERLIARGPRMGRPEVGESALPKEGLWGNVVDVEGKGIPDVKVEAGVFKGDSPASLTRKVLVRNTMTGSDGEFWFREKAAFSPAIEILRGRALPQESPGGLYGLIIASKEGYCAARNEIDFESVTGEQKIILREAPEISGRVIWKESQEPIGRVEVVCTPEESDIYQVSKVEGRADKEGNFSLTISAEGAAKLWAEFVNAFEPEPTWPNLVLAPGEKTTNFILEVALLSDTILEGRVLEENGDPIAGAEVRLSYGNTVQSPATRSQEDGQYRLMVRRNWWYRSYNLRDWPEKPRWRVTGAGWQGFYREAGGSSRRDLPDGKWDWAEYWTPPPNAPPERLLGFHPNYEMGVVEVPLLGVGQLRKGVDIVLYKGSKVSGRVLDHNSQPLSGAEIAIKLEPVEGGVLMEVDLSNGYGVKDGKTGRWHLEPKKVRSGEDGTFDIRFLREGSYQLRATHEDCDPETKELELQPHQAVEGFDFVLAKRVGFIRGKVLNENGNPWRHGTVRTSGTHVFYRGGYCTGVKEDGSYELTEMKPGNYTLWLDVSADYPQPEGILWASSLRDVPTGTEGAVITVRELPAGALRVRVLDQAKQPVAKFHLECCPLSMSYGGSGILRSPLQRAKSEAVDSSGFGAYTRDAKYSGILHFKRDIVSETGELVAERAAPGSYFVLVKADKHGEEFEEVKIEAGAETEVTFELRSLGRLEGVVVNNQGQPLSGVLIRAMKIRDFLNSTELLTRGEWFSAWENVYSLDKTRSGPDGRFALENLEQTEYRVTARDEEGRGVFTDVAIGESGRGFVELVFDYGSSSIQGFVYGGDASPVSGARVFLEGSGQTSRTRSDDQGHYAFWDLPPGNYLVKARIEGIHYLGQQVDLGEDEQASVDLVAVGEAEVEGSISLAGDAARAAAWSPYFIDRRLILKELTDTGIAGGKQLHLPVEGTFELKNIPAGTYEARAYLVVMVSPEPVPYYHSWPDRRSQVKFVSEPQIARVASRERATLHLTITQACAPHYPIPDAATCDRGATWVLAE